MDTFIILLGMVIFTFLINLPLGMWRETVRKFSLTWIIAVHASVPIVIALRIWLQISNWAIPFLILIAIIGQYVGAKMYRNKIALQQQIKKVGDE